MGDPLYGAVLGLGVVYQGEWRDFPEETIAAFRSVGLDPSTAELTDVIRRRIGLTEEEEREYHEMWRDENDERRRARIAKMTADIERRTMYRYGVGGFDEICFGDDDQGGALIVPRGAKLSACGPTPEAVPDNLVNWHGLTDVWWEACRKLAEDIPGGRGPDWFLVAKT